MLMHAIAWLCFIQSLYAMNYYFQEEQPRLSPIAIPDVSIPVPAMDCLTPREQEARNIHYCPDVSDLSRQGTTWSAPGNWKSYQVSFISTVTRFMGAQWMGTNVGRTVCLYSGDNSNDFPVQLVFPALSELPDLPLWKAGSNSNTADCVSNQGLICDCPIKVFQEDAEINNAKSAVMNIEGHSFLASR